MNKELIEMVNELEFDEIEQVLKMEIEPGQMAVILQEEAERRCKITVAQVQQQLSYLVNTELTMDEVLSDVLNVLESTDLGIDIQNPFSILEEIDGQIQGLYPCSYQTGEEEYCGGLIGIVIEFEPRENGGDEEDNDVYEWDEEVEEIVITDMSVYYSNAQKF